MLRLPDWNDTDSSLNQQGNFGIKLGEFDEGYPGFLLGQSPFWIWFTANAGLAISNNDTQSNYSKSEIQNSIDLGEEGLGDYFLDITVDSEEGGSFQCQHNDDGEQVDYEIQLITWDYNIEWCSDCEVFVPPVV